MRTESLSTASGARPLGGKRVLITRPREQAEEFAALLEARGAEVLIMPTIKIEGPEDWTETDRALERLDQYDWLVFTSANAVNSLCQRSKPDGAFSRPKVCAVGPATARALTAHDLRADLIPEPHTAEGVLAAFPERLDGVRFLFPRGNLARDTLPEGLRRRGALVDEVVVYRTVTAEPPNPVLLQMLQAGSIDVVTFTSSSTAKNFVRLIGEERFKHLKNRFATASIGPKTSQTIRELDVPVDIEAPASTAAGLVQAIVGYFAPGPET